MIQPFDEGRFSAIRSHTHLPVRVYDLNTPSADVTPDLALLTGADAPPRHNRVRDENAMSGFFLLSDIENQPVLLVGVDTPRTASRQMADNITSLIAAFAGLGLIYILITGYLLQRTIVVPLTDLDREMKQIGEQKDLGRRLPVQGDDEITSLKVSFNAMLQELQDKENELARQGSLLAEAHRKANLYLDIYLDVLTYEILNVTISLQAYAELIRESGDMTNQEYADRITSALNRNLSVIRNIETISKIYKNPPGQGPVSLRTIADREGKKFPGIPIRIPQEDVMVAADEMLGIVFYNIILNCIKFGRDDLAIEISVRDLPGGTVEVSILDNGIGIIDEMKPLIFDRFMKGSDKRSSYGLGLHIVKMLIEAYGGKVWADDRIPGRPEQGAAIRFTLQKA
jgi:signal transduction histidine kinase